MKRVRNLLFLMSVLCFSVSNIFAQNSNIVKTDLSQAEIDRIIKTFTSKEAEFRVALNSYVFNRSATFQTLGMGGQVSGVYRRDSLMNLMPDGTRIEKIVFFPVPTTSVITAEDLEDLGGVTPFALEPSAAPKYNIIFIGKEKIDELNLYVFDVTPKVIPDPKKSKLRLFTGRVWVDDSDLQIVKAKGKAVPETKINKFPIVETWRENVDGKYWFPSYATSDDELIFDDGTSYKIRLRVKYTNYGVGKSDVKILDDDETVPELKPAAKPTPSPTPKKP